MKKIFIIALAEILVSNSLAGQCPANDSLWTRLSFLGKATNISSSDKLKELLEWERRTKPCLLDGDTTRAFLLQKIGSLFFTETDYIQAARYTEMSISITASVAGNSTLYSTLQIKKFYDLSRMYDSLRNVRKRMAALDSCIAIASRIDAIDVYYLFALYAKAQYYFDIGDYHRCINYAGFCEKMGQLYTQRTPTDQYNTGRYYSFSSLASIVNAYLRLENYEAAEGLLSNKMEECRKEGLKDYFGTLCGQLADVKEQEGDYKQALLLYKRALAFEEAWGSNYNCRVVLNNIGYIYGKRIKDRPTALLYYKKALRYRDRKKPLNRMDTLEMMNISSNIGIIYSQQNQID